jgi:hypothetical protein
MNEIFLLIVVVGILFGLHFLINRIKKPKLQYLKILVAIALLLLIWIFDRNGHFGPKLILSAIALSVLFKEFFFIRKAQVKDNRQA